MTPTTALASLSQQAQEFAAAAKANNTIRAYHADWQDFRRWCEAHRRSPLPATPETVALFLTDRAATLKSSSLARRLTTINRAHQAAGQTSPATMQNAMVSEVWKGIKRRKGTAQHGKKPLLTPDVRRMIGDCRKISRDCGIGHCCWLALLKRLSQIGTGRTAGRGSESDCGWTDRAAGKVEDRSGGQGRPVALPYGSDPSTCPVRAIRAWLERSGITAGPIFRGVDRLGSVSERALHADSIAYLVKRAAGRSGLEAMDYAGHSLRAGLATQAAMNGASELAIMKQTGHRSLATVRKYIREGSLFRDNAAAKLGL